MEDILDTLDALGAETDDALERFMDDEDMYLKYVMGFPKEGTMAKLRADVAAKDYAAAEKSVHALKGILNNLGFLPVADAAVDMLAELRANDIEAALEAFEELNEEYDKYVAAINRYQEGK